MNGHYPLQADEQLALEQFYYREARLLDNRQYQQWLTLLSPDISYQMPARVNKLINNRDRGNEDMISVDRELEDAASMGCPIREENIIHLSVRVERAYKVNSWSESPPARTRRIIGNIEALNCDSQTIEVVSNFHLHYSRPGNADTTYSGQRRDILNRLDAGAIQVAKRVVIMDYSTIEVPTLGLLL